MYIGKTDTCPPLALFLFSIFSFEDFEPFFDEARYSENRDSRVAALT